MAAKLSWEGRVKTWNRCIYLLVLQSEINKIIIKSMKQYKVMYNLLTYGAVFLEWSKLKAPN
jgi:hypothetical protein